MLDKSNIGRVFIMADYSRVQIFDIGKCSNQDWYFVNSEYPEPARGGWDLWKEEDLEFYESKQRDWEESEKRYNIRLKEQEEKERIEAEEKARQEDLYGFDSKMTPMQKGKTLKILMKKFRHNTLEFNEETRGFDIVSSKVFTRKDFIVERLSNGASVFEKVYSGKKYYGITNEKIKVFDRFEEPFTEITKTEYKFAQYLIDNNIVDKLKEAA